MKHLLRRVLEDLGKLTVSDTYPSVADSSLDREAYDQGWHDYDKYINTNPYDPGSVQHDSWTVGHRDADRHDRSLW
ncbi:MULTISPECIES: hypothetical protein [Burkholderia]|uniref:hypothetical protein n=1 Tax=Burkholderia TaxID=32008 RepID=UPI000DC2E0D0|nr:MULTISPECIES: hypothetical protein [Burkholderia]MDP9544170.1 hypothetical protein [Burkholderia cepacia]MBR8394374.1 hypothetical protein [Burkholderia cenocepacia]MBR8471891.1 hypothetical protein [Burkholderia cenocepacia]MBR8487713.1 hypothetical protein [Burkholderia cenocepacia]MDO5917473.1 hypothetical protein [Burkholderia cenocepacia]